MAKRLMITAGEYAGRTLQLSDEVAAKAIADKWAYDPAEHQGEEIPTPDGTPESLVAFEQDPEGSGEDGGEDGAEEAKSGAKPRSRKRASDDE